MLIYTLMNYLPGTASLIEEIDSKSLFFCCYIVKPYVPALLRVYRMMNQVIRQYLIVYCCHPIIVLKVYVR